MNTKTNIPAPEDDSQAPEYLKKASTEKPQIITSSSPAPEGRVEISQPTPVLEKELPLEQGTAEIKEQKENFLEEAINNLTNKLRSTKKKPFVIPQIKDEITVEIERVMEQDLREAFNALTPVQKQEFKIKGEETAWRIRELLKRTHVKVKSVFKLIFEWLKMLPGINRFFLEQEAKIKTDKIIALHEIEKTRKNLG